MANSSVPVPEVKLDALLPGEMAAKAEAVGVKKATGDAMQLFALAVLAGAFIGLGAIFCFARYIRRAPALYRRADFNAQLPRLWRLLIFMAIIQAKSGASTILIFIHGAELWKSATALPGGLMASHAWRNSSASVISRMGKTCSSCATLRGP